jgi:hypothetical protein
VGGEPGMVEKPIRPDDIADEAEADDGEKDAKRF